MTTVNPTTTRTPAAGTPATPTPSSPEQPREKHQQSFLEMMSRASIHSAMVVEDGVRETVVDRPTTTAVIGGGGNAVLALALAQRHANSIRAEGGIVTRGQLGGMATNNFLVNGIRVTPSLVSAVLGPAIADGVSYLAPNLVPKYKDSDKALKEKKSEIQMRRAIAAGVAVTAIAGVVWLVKPNLLKSAGIVSEKAIEGYTKVALAGGGTKTIVGAAGALPEGAQILKQVAPMAQHAPTFSTRLVLGLAGGGTAAFLGNKAVMADGETRKKYAIAAAATGVATLGGIALAPQLVKSSVVASTAGEVFWKPNFKWVKEFGYKIAPITSIPAGTAAFNYLDIVNDFDEVVSPRSPFNKKR